MMSSVLLLTLAIFSVANCSRLLYIAAWQAAIRSNIGPLIKIDRPIALINMPLHNNVGDSALAMGELKLLRELGVPSSLLVANATVPPNTGIVPPDVLDLLRRIVQPQNGTILFAGGGNMGSIYQTNQHLYTSLIKEFRHVRIIHLPQSLVVSDETQFVKMHGEPYRSHADLHLFLRDRASFELAKRMRLIGDPNRLRLVPDMAFMLGDQSWRVDLLSTAEQVQRETTPFVWMERGDAEAVSIKNQTLQKCLDAFSHDDRVRGPLDWRNENAFRNGPLAADRNEEFRDKMLLDVYYERELDRGTRLLLLGKVLLTDRLHGQIIGFLLGLPVVVLPDNTRKGQHFYDTWTFVDKLVTAVSSHCDAFSTAQAFLRGAVTAPPSWLGALRLRDRQPLVSRFSPPSIVCQSGHRASNLSVVVKNMLPGDHALRDIDSLTSSSDSIPLCDVVLRAGAPCDYMSKVAQLCHDNAVILFDTAVSKSDCEIGSAVTVENVIGWPPALGRFSFCTVVLMTYPAGRLSTLPYLFEHYSMQTVVRELVLVWNGPRQSAPSISAEHRSFVRVVSMGTNSLNNRYSSDLNITTDAVLIVDDDGYPSSQTIHRMMRVWLNATNSLVGVTPRALTGQAYGKPLGAFFHFVLPHAMMFHRSYLAVYSSKEFADVRNFVDNDEGHCDDLAFNMLVTKISQRGVLLIDGAAYEAFNTSRSGLYAQQQNRADVRFQCAHHLLNLTTQILARYVPGVSLQMLRGEIVQ